MTAPSLAVIILNFKRPQNIGRIVEAAREGLPEAPIFLLDQAQSDDLHLRSDIAWSEVWFERAGRNLGAGVRVELAAQLPFDVYVAIDDDIFLSPEQIAALAGRVRGAPDRVHGVSGQRLELHEGRIRLRSVIRWVDAQLSILNSAYAFSRAQAAAAIGLSAQLGFASWDQFGPVDDILLSCAGSKPPLCHDLGGFAECPTNVQADIATWLSADFSLRREAVIAKLLAAQRIAVFSPDAGDVGVVG